MKIAIIVAMQKELHLLLGRMGHDIRLVTFEDHPYYFGSIGQHKIIATTCGIGKVNAALATDTLIRNFTPELVINTGVAGGVGADGVKVLDVVWGERVAYHDVWCGPGTRWGEAADCPLYFESNKSLIAPGTLDNIPSCAKVSSARATCSSRVRKKSMPYAAASQRSSPSTWSRPRSCRRATNTAYP